MKRATGKTARQLRFEGALNVALAAWKNRSVFPVATMCRVLGLSPSGFYAWQKRGLSARAIADVMLTAEITASHARSDGTYGAPRILRDLRDMGKRVGQKRVARLMRAAGVVGVSRRRWVCTTQRGPVAEPVPDLVQRDFVATAPNQLWVADITYVSTWTGFLYLAVVLDAFSRRIVGWAMATHLKTELVLAALEMARAQRWPRDVIHHSDHGTQYTSLAFGDRCKTLGVRLSRGSVGSRPPVYARTHELGAQRARGHRSARPPRHVLTFRGNC